MTTEAVRRKDEKDVRTSDDVEDSASGGAVNHIR